MKTKNKRSFKHFDQDISSRNFSQIPFYVAYVFEDVDAVAWVWVRMFTDLLDEHAPVKKLIKREHVPFMTTELPDAIRCRRKFKPTYHATKNLVDWQKYKDQRNKTSSLRRKLICKYIRSKCDDANGDPRAFWTIVKPFTHSKNNSGDNTITLKEDNEVITDNNVITLMFNEHFSKIHNNSAEYPVMGNHYGSSSHPSICAIPNNCPYIKSFNFQLISPAEVQQVLGKLDPNKATGHDGIPAKVLRDCSGGCSISC